MHQTQLYKGVIQDKPQSLHHSPLSISTSETSHSCNMGSESPPRIPTIDFSKIDLTPGCPGWDSVRQQVMEALEEYSCFEAIYDKVPAKLHQALNASLEELFDLPLPVKMQNKSKKAFHGYFGQHPSIPYYESMGIDDARVLERAESFTNQNWPEGNPSFCNAIHLFSKGVADLDGIVRRMMLEGLGMEKYYDEHIGSTNHLFRVMKYQAPQTNDAKIGLKPHTDKNVLTILSQNQVNGLEVMGKDGNWIEVKVSPNSFVLMLGDSMLAWSNGRLKSALHRVMLSGNEVRYSTASFSIPKAGYLVKAPEELVDEEHPLLFKPFDVVAFLAFYYTEEGQNCENPLKTYCGI